MAVWKVQNRYVRDNTMTSLDRLDVLIGMDTQTGNGHPAPASHVRPRVCVCMHVCACAHV